MTLSEIQRAATEHDGRSICVVAGPGSGKTRVLIERFAWLVEKRSVDPGRILAITFTEKAANEMKRRLVARFAYSAGLREKVENAWISTIDAFCARVLGENAIAAGLPPDFTVLDAPQAECMQREAAEAALDELFAESPAEMRRLMEALDLSTQDGGPQPDLGRSLIGVYETMRLAGSARFAAQRRGERPDTLAEARQRAQELRFVPLLADWAARFLALPERVSREHLEAVGRFDINLNKLGSRTSAAYRAAHALKTEILPRLEAEWIEQYYAGLPQLLETALGRLDRRFREAKRARSAVDFADLEEKTIELLERDAGLRERIRGRFEHVLMDELQDTNRLQWRLVGLIRKNLFAVGDINQSIYGFRHADRAVFEEFRAEAEVLELSENYRCRPEILEKVAAILEGQEGVEERVLIARRSSAGAPVIERLAGTGDDPVADEAGQVAARIQQLVSSGERRYEDIAILVRTLASAAAFESALDRLHIPYLLSGGRMFFEARETRDLLALLAALVNPLDDVALLTVLRSPLLGWSDERLLRAGREGRLAEFERLFGRARRLASVIPPDRLIAEALDECAYAAPLNERARANVDKFLAWLRREHRARPRPLAELLEDLEAFREAQAEAEAPPPEAAAAVRILSIHAAKGLEFPVVFVSALHRGPDRRTPVILFSPESGLGAKWRNPATGCGVSDPVHAALAERRKQAEQKEEHRLLYVALTRAADRLILSHASQERRASNWVKLAARIPLAEPPRADAPPGLEAVPRAVAETVLPKPKLSAQYDSSVSATSVALFAACPRKYLLARYLGLESGTRPGTGAVELGLEVHRALAGKASASAEARGLVQRFLVSELGRRAALAPRVEREFDFMFTLGDLVLRGQIDLWFEDRDGLALVDYKTDGDESGAAEYALQLRLYALALERLTGRLPALAALFYLRSGKALEVSLAPEDLDAARSAAHTFAEAQNSLEFPMKVGGQCRRCTFWGGLCAAVLPEGQSLA